MQVVAVVAPGIVEYVPATQAMHGADPVVVLYVPVAHVEHVEPSGSV